MGDVVILFIDLIVSEVGVGRLCFAKMMSDFKINELPDRLVTLLAK